MVINSRLLTVLTNLPVKGVIPKYSGALTKNVLEFDHNKLRCINYTRIHKQYVRLTWY